MQAHIHVNSQAYKFQQMKNVKKNQNHIFHLLSIQQYCKVFMLLTMLSPLLHFP